MGILRAILIHLVVPGAGVLLYLSLICWMLERQIKKPPAISFFIIFATWGTLLVLVLTRFFWYWSGMATLGLAYLIFLAPIVMGVIAVRIYLDRKQSHFHQAAFFASVSYVPIIACVIVGSNLWSFPFK